MTTRTQSAVVAPRAGAFWRAYAIHMRPYLLFVSGITGLAGLSLYADFSISAGLILFLAFFLSYGFGQALTDCFQTDTDAISSPYRPLVQGRILREHVLAVSLGGLIVCGAVMAAANPLTIPLAFFGIVGLLTYTPFKRRWWAGPFYNAWIVAVVFIIGVFDGAPSLGIRAVWRPEVLAAAAAVFFGYANFVLAGYFKDVWADRATGYDTLPVRYGMKVAARVSDAFAATGQLAAAAALYLVVARSGAGSIPLFAVIVLGAAIAVSVVAQVLVHRVRREAEAYRAIGLVVHAYMLALSSITIALRPHWALPLAAFYAMFWITMWRRPATRQI